jgi:hypothetical protein
MRRLVTVDVLYRRYFEAVLADGKSQCTGRTAAKLPTCMNVVNKRKSYDNRRKNKLHPSTLIRSACLATERCKVLKLK